MPIEEAACTANKLIIQLQQQCNVSTDFDLSRQQCAIKIIKEIYQFNIQQSPRVEEPGAKALRVEPTLFSNPTAPRTLKTTKQTHNCVTRNNTPGLVSIPVPTRQSPHLNPVLPTTHTTAPLLQQPTPTPPATLPGALSKSPSTQRRTPTGFSQIF